MFEAEPRWEPIDPAEVSEPPLPSASLARASRATSSGGGASPSVPASLPPDALLVTGAQDGGAAEPVAAEPTAEAAAHPADPLHVDHHTDPHAAPFEHKGAPRHAPARDGYNRGAVHSDHASAHVFGRPGVVSHGHGIFQIKSDTRYGDGTTIQNDTVRYTYTAHGDVNVATPFDVIHKTKLLSVNTHAHLGPKDQAKAKQEKDEGRTMRLALNPAEPRKLSIDGHEKWCVLSWVDGGGGGAAWIPVSELKGNTHQIRVDVAKEAKHEAPSHKLSPSTPYIIRDDAVGHADTTQDEPKDKHGKSHGRVLAPGAKGGDNVSHYLEKDISKSAFDHGKPTGGTETRRFVALCMNLPEGPTPPVAVDTALAGDTFFAFNDAKFHREVAVYENGAHHSKRRQMWVFGHLGKHDGKGKDPDAMVPDPARAGWVPLRVLRLP